MYFARVLVGLFVSALVVPAFAQAQGDVHTISRELIRVKSPQMGSTQNAAVASTGADSSSVVTYFESEKVAAGFAKGGALFDGSAGGKNFRVNTGRRDKPGMGEVHGLDTDIVYVVEGSATFVTGGTVVDPENTAPNEIRGKGIQGGETHHLSKGDVIIIPNGVPHWFKEVQAPFLYFLVKSR